MAKCTPITPKNVQLSFSTTEMAYLVANRRKTEVSKSTVNNIVKHYEAISHYTPKSQSGRTGITTKRDDHSIRRLVIKNPQYLQQK
jgi:hypothetical protein